MTRNDRPATTVGSRLAWILIVAASSVASAEVVLHTEDTQRVAEVPPGYLPPSFDLAADGRNVHICWTGHATASSAPALLWHALVSTRADDGFRPRAEVTRVATAPNSSGGCRITWSAQGPLVAWSDDECVLMLREWDRVSSKWLEPTRGPARKSVCGNATVFRTEFGFLAFRPFMLLTPRLIQAESQPAGATTAESGDAEELPRYAIEVTAAGPDRWAFQSALLFTSPDGPTMEDGFPVIMQEGANYAIFIHGRMHGCSPSTIRYYSYDPKGNTLRLRREWPRPARPSNFQVTRAPDENGYVVLWTEYERGPTKTVRLYCVQSKRPNNVLEVATAAAEECFGFIGPTAIARTHRDGADVLVAWCNPQGEIVYVECDTDRAKTSTSRRAKLNLSATSMGMVALDDTHGLVVVASDDRIVYCGLDWK